MCVTYELCRLEEKKEGASPLASAYGYGFTPKVRGTSPRICKRLRRTLKGKTLKILRPLNLGGRCVGCRQVLFLPTLVHLLFLPTSDKLKESRLELF